MQHAYTLVVLTLLQLCRAEIPEALPEWYAANLINDGGYPKPITEIFTTPDTFSSKNPIIVTSTSESGYTLRENVLSTLPSTSDTQPSPTELPPASDDTTRRVIPLMGERPSSFQPNGSPNQVNQTPPNQMNQTPPNQVNQTPPNQMNQTPPNQVNQTPPNQVNQTPPNQVNQTPLNQMNRTPPQFENLPTSSQPLDMEVPTHLPPPREISSSSPQPLDMPRQMYQPMPQQIQVLLAQPNIQPSQQIQPSPQVPQVTVPPSPQTPPTPNPPCSQSQVTVPPINQHQTTGQPNYFLIYQQAPVSIQQYRESASQTRSETLPSTTQTTPSSTASQITTQEATRTTTRQPSSTTEVEASTTQSSSSYKPITSPPSNMPRNIRQEQITFWQNPSPVPGATYYNSPISSAMPLDPILIPCLNASSLRQNTSTPTTMAPSQRKSGLTIRVSAPRGSITNIKINPSTTTKKPNSRRPQRKKGNNYNNCVESCKGKKEPLCAAPLAVLPIDPNKLRGFPSICHLACHNSFRKNQPFEKIMDGRCSRLRTRIRTFDKNKLKKEELDKAQYTVLNNVPETIVQVIQNERSGY